MARESMRLRRSGVGVVTRVAADDLADDPLVVVLLPNGMTAYLPADSLEPAF